MKIVNQKFEHIYNEDPQKHIEEIARTCYKSESAITDVSNKIFISKLYKMKHWAMLEHFIFIYEIPLSLFTIFNMYILSPKYSSEIIIDLDLELVRPKFLFVSNISSIKNKYFK